MLSFNRLGSYGRLGNQMFQYAALKGIARKNNHKFCIPFSPEINEWYDHMLAKNFVLDSNLIIDSPQNQNSYSENFFHFDEVLFENCPDFVDLIGYFQSYRYFDFIRDEIVSDFRIKEEFKKPIDSYTAVHVRRGDYVNQPMFHPVCSADYYRQAMQITGGPFVIVSDDIEWCKQNISGDFYMEGSSSIQDMSVMKQAENVIIANSSFSWWGAWLNQNSDKIVICPENWFGPAYSHYNMNDIRPSDWIKI